MEDKHKTGTSINGNGNVAVGEVGMADLSTTASGNVAQTHGEALQSQLQPQVGSDGTLSQKPLETPENGLRTQNGQNITNAMTSEQGKKPQKSNKTPILIGIIIVLVLCLAGAVTWGVIMMQKVNDNAAQEDVGQGGQENKPVEKPVEDGDRELSEAEIDAEVKRIRDLAKAELEKYWGQYGEVELVDEDNANDVTVFYKPDDMITPVVLNKIHGVKAEYDFNLGINYTVVYDEAYNKIESLLTREGFEDTGMAYSLASTGSGDSVFVNGETGVVCNVSRDARVSCGYKTWYDVDDAKLSDELARVILAATGEDPEIVVAKVEQIKDSEVAPYQTIEVIRHGFGSMLYRVSPEASWQYFTSGQAAPGCEEYNTEDLRKAFAGQRCLARDGEEWKEITVQP